MSVCPYDLRMCLKMNNVAPMNIKGDNNKCGTGLSLCNLTHSSSFKAENSFNSKMFLMFDN